MAGEEGADAGAFLADAGQGPGVGDGVGAAAAVLRRHRHAEDVVLLRQRDQVIVEAVLDVAQFLMLAQFLAERLDVGQQSALIRGVHRGLLVLPLAASRSHGAA